MKYICGSCIDEEYLNDYVEQFGEINKCYYCNTIKKVCQLETIIEIIEEGIEFIYDDPVNGLGFIDGEYVKGSVEFYDDTFDLLTDALGLGGSKAFQDIIHSLPQNSWCKKEFYTFDSAQERIYTWDYFCDQIKYKTRYFFIKEKTDIKNTVRYKEPYTILYELVNSFIDLGLIDVLKKNIIIYRARKSENNNKYSTPEELGPPKSEECIYSNRMSPAGIPMFYGSLSKETCISELGREKGLYIIGKWIIKKDLLVLNLTKYFIFDRNTDEYYFPKFPSIFDKYRREKIFDYIFILKFASDLSKKLDEKSRENIDYIPTQVVAEYLRKFALIENRHLDGICFYSSIDGGINYSLFFEQDDCLNTKQIESQYQKIELIEVEEIYI